MKNSQILISNIFESSDPKVANLKHLSTLPECQRLRLFLPMSIKETLLGIYPKNHRVLFAFSNKITCNEFNTYHTKKILTSIRENAQFFSILSQMICAQSNHKKVIEGYVPKNYLYQAPSLISFTPVYTERSLANFKNHCSKDTVRHTILESIRNCILENQNTQNHVTL